MARVDQVYRSWGWLELTQDTFQKTLFTRLQDLIRKDTRDADAGDRRVNRCFGGVEH